MRHQRTINGRNLLIVLAGLAVWAGGIHFVHGYQVRRHAGVLLRQSEVEEQAGRLKESATYLNRYLAFAPGDVAARTRYGLVLARLDSPRALWEAVSNLEQVLRSKPEEYDARRALVRLDMSLGRFADAREHIENLVSTFPGDGQLQQSLGECLESIGRFREAVDAFEQAVNKGAPDWLGCACARARLFRDRLGDPERADDVMNALVQAHPTYQSYLSRSRYWKAAAQREKALTDIEKALKLAPEEGEVLIAAAETARERGRFAEARELLEHGRQAHPENVYLTLALAQVHLEAGRHGDAVRLLRAALHSVGGHPDCLGNIAVLLTDAGELDGPEGARALIGRLRQMGFVPELLEFLEARMAFQEKKWSRACASLERVRDRLTAFPDLAKHANLLLGRCQQQLLNSDQQLAAYRSALKIDPLWVPAALELAATLTDLGRLDEAIDEYRKIVPVIDDYRKIAPQTLDGRLPLARLLLARNLEFPPERQNWKELDQVLGEAMRRAPDSVEAAVLRAQALLARDPKQAGAARGYVQTAVNKHPEQVSGWLELARFALDSGDLTGAKNILGQARERAGDRVEFRIARAELEVKQRAGSVRDHLHGLEDGADKMTPGDRALLLSSLGSAYQQAELLDDAERIFTRLCQEQPHDLRARTRLFDVQSIRGDERAMERSIADMQALEGAIGELTGFAQAVLAIARARHGDTQGLEEARSRLTEIGARRPSWWRVPSLRGQIEELQGDQEAALEDYQSAMRLGNREPEVIRRSVQLLYDRQRYAEADRLLQQLPADFPLTGELGRAAAEISLVTQNRERAVELARRAVAKTSTDYRDYLWLGQILSATGKSDEAEKTIRHAIQLGGPAPGPWAALVFHLVRAGRTKAAETVIQEARQSLPPSQAPLALAPCYEAVGRPEKAEEEYRRALAAEPNGVFARRSAADFYLRRGELPKAEPLLRALIDPEAKATPEDLAWARRGLALSLGAHGSYRDFKEGLGLIEANIERGGRVGDDLRAKAHLLARQPHWRKEAIDLFEELGCRQVRAAQDELVLARLYDQTGERSRAREHFLGALSSQERNPEYLAEYVRFLMRRQEYRDAESWLARLEAVQPNTFATTELKALLLHARGSDAAAVSLLNKLAEKASTDFRATAALMEKLGRDDLAEQMLRKQLAADRKAESLVVLARFLAGHHRVAEALDRCQEAIGKGGGEQAATTAVAVLQAGGGTAEQFRRVEGWVQASGATPPRSLALLGNLRDLEERWPEAQALFRQALDRDPENLVALNDLAWLLSFKPKTASEALGLINRAIEIGGYHADLLDTRAVVSLALGDSESAVRDLEEAALLASDPAKHFHLARAYGMANQPALARDAWNRAKRSGFTERTLHPLERPAYRQLMEQFGETAETAPLVDHRPG